MDSEQLLTPEKLCWRCPVEELGFQTTDELEDLGEVLGQSRALESVRFGIGIRHEGYNLFVLGPPGVGKRTIVRQLLQSQASDQPTPSDWCYVQNFEQSGKPRLLSLPAGRGVKLRQDMELLVDELQTAIQAAIEAEEHQSRVDQIEHEAKQHHDEAFSKLAEKAKSQGIQLVRTPGGFALAPLKGDEIVSPEEFDELPEEEQKRIESAVGALQEELRELVEQVPRWRAEAREKVKQLNREATSLAVSHSLKQLKVKYNDLPQVLGYLDAVEKDVTERADEFRPSEEPTVIFGMRVSEDEVFRRYQVNVFVDNGETVGGPVVYEDHPNYQNLLGRVEHITHMGTLVTDFTLIRPGALHRANGGYLILEARRLLQQPYAWEGLKRALFAKHIKIESLAEALSLVSTVSLQPQPVPLDVKVILLGDRLLYYLMYAYDPDFAELFKVAADFNDHLDRTPETCRVYARLIATLVRRDKLRPFDASAVARVIEHGSRMADDSEKVTTHIRAVGDLLREADFYASQRQDDIVNSTHVGEAIDNQIHRADRVREQIQEQIQQNVLLVDTTGERIGQVNGLSVHEVGGLRFGRPTRITATTRLGRGEVIDIEREVELGGALHSKGVLILSSFLAARFAKDHPLSLNASLVFEQSYGPVEGDSASLAELCGLLSSLAEAPVRQSLAITGSVNQHGEVQPIGGVNEKIEGFFDTCQARGLTGEQGVLIPSSNVRHLMLRRDVVEAAETGRFHIYAVATVDEATSLLTGVAAGACDEQGEYPEGTLNARAAARLKEMFDLRQRFGKETSSGQSSD